MIVTELCTRALKLAGVVGVGEDPSAEDMADSISTLNDMLFAWALDGMDLGHSEVAANDELFVDSAYLKAVRYALAVELAAEFGTQLAESVVMIALDEMNRVRDSLADIDTLRCDDAVIRRSWDLGFSTN